METTNRKISIIVIMIAIINTIIIWLTGKARKKTDKEIQCIQEKVNSIISEGPFLTKEVGNLFGDISLLIENMRKIYLILEILKLNSTYAIQNTIISILKSDKVPSLRDTNITLLNNLIVEYSANIIELKNKVAVSEHEVEKERIGKIISELEGLTTLISTISSDSSDEYITQIYVEVFVSVNKIKNI